MMKQTLFAGAALLLTAAGCRSIPENASKPVAADSALAADPVPNLPRLSGTEAEYRKGREMGDALLAAIRNGDEKAFEAALPAHLNKRPGQAKAYLKGTQTGFAALGTVCGVEYLGCLDQTVVHDHLWKVTFELPVKRAADGQREQFRRTRMFQVSVILQNGKLTVGNFRFQ